MWTCRFSSDKFHCPAIISSINALVKGFLQNIFVFFNFARDYLVFSRDFSRFLVNAEAQNNGFGTGISRPVGFIPN